VNEILLGFLDDVARPHDETGTAEGKAHR